MRLPFFLTFILLAYLFGISGCVQCQCCGAALGSVQCNKDTIHQVILISGAYQSVIANAQDTFNYYTAKGYTCTQYVGLGPSEPYERRCSSLGVKIAKDGGDACATDNGITVYCN